jgi:hypothetical protein
MTDTTFTKKLASGTRILFICLALLGASAVAESGKPCSNRTLSGDYGYSAEGVLLPAPGVSVQFRSIGMTHFDGKGHITWLEHTVIDGHPTAPGWTPSNGTYDVNPDCTGTAVVITPFSADPLVLSLVIVKQGKEFRTELDAHAIVSTFAKVD